MVVSHRGQVLYLSSCPREGEDHLQSSPTLFEGTMKLKPFMIVKIGGMDIEVYKLPGDSEVFGDFTYINTRIRIDQDLKKGALVDTLIHEINHAAYAIGQLKKDDDEERVVSVFASIWTQIYRDNPHLLKFIQKELR